MAITNESLEALRRIQEKQAQSNTPRFDFDDLQFGTKRDTSELEPIGDTKHIKQARHAIKKRLDRADAILDNLEKQVDNKAVIQNFIFLLLICLLLATLVWYSNGNQIFGTTGSSLFFLVALTLGGASIYFIYRICTLSRHLINVVKNDSYKNSVKRTKKYLSKVSSELGSLVNFPASQNKNSKIVTEFNFDDELSRYEVISQQQQAVFSKTAKHFLLNLLILILIWAGTYISIVAPMRDGMFPYVGIVTVVIHLLFVGILFIIYSKHSALRREQKGKKSSTARTVIRVIFKTLLYIITSSAIGLSYFYINAITLPLITRNTTGYYEQLPTLATQAIPCGYLEAQNYSEGLAAVRRGNVLRSKWGYIDTLGNEVIPFIYDSAKPFTDGYAEVRTGDNRLIYIDREGNEAGTLDDGSSGRSLTYRNGLAIVRGGSETNYTHQLVYQDGTVVVPFGRYTQIRFTTDDFFIVREGSGRDQRWGALNPYGMEILPCVHLHSPSVSDGIVRARLDNNSPWVFYDSMGNRIASYPYANGFSGGYAAVRDEDKYGFIDKTGNEVIPQIYTTVSSFSEGFVAVKIDEKWGYINTSGRNITSFVYDTAADFSDGLAMVSQNGKYGYINTSGNIVIPLEYSYARSFQNGFAIVKENNMYGCIDKTGQVVMPFIIDDSLYSVPESSNHRPFVVGEQILVQLQQRDTDNRTRYGFINEAGDVVVPFIYDREIVFSEELAPVLYKDKWGYISIPNMPDTIIEEENEE